MLISFIYIFFLENIEVEEDLISLDYERNEIIEVRNKYRKVFYVVDGVKDSE